MRVPITLLGNVRLVSKKFLGSLGQTLSAPVEIRYPFLGNFAYYLFWILLLPFFFFKKNQNRQIWLILLLTICLHALFLSLDHMLDLARSLEILLFPLATAIGGFWLSGDLIRHLKAWMKPLILLLIFLLFGYLGVLVSSGFNSQPGNVLPSLVIYLIAGLVLTFGLKLAHVILSKVYKRWALPPLMLIVDLALFCLGMLIIISLIQAFDLIGPNSDRFVQYFRSRLLVAGLALGFLIWLSSLTVILIGFKSEKMARRFKNLFGVKI